MFGNFLELFFSAWRDSLAKVQYILNPSDPTQLEAEQPQYLMAQYLSAYIYCKENLGGQESSPAEVDQYMIKRAEKSPFR